MSAYLEIVDYMLRRRRAAGITRETDAQAGPEVVAYTRVEYEAQCAEVGRAPVADEECLRAVAEREDSYLADWPPAGEPRVEPAEGHCAQCGRRIVGSAFTASLGRVCSLECYDAMESE